MPKGASTEESAAPAPANAPAAPAAPAPTSTAAKPTSGSARKPAAKKAAPAPPAGPSLGELLEASRSAREQPYLEAIGRVAELRKTRQIGALQGAEKLAAEEVGGGVATRYPSMQPMTIPAASRPVPMGASSSQRGPMVVRPTQAPTPLTPQELSTQTQRQLATRAMETGRQFSDAISAYQQSVDATDAAVRSPDVAKATFPALAADQRKRLEAVLSLAAQMREYGFVGSNEDLMTRFAPK